MSRTGLNRIPKLGTVVCGTERTNEANQWNLAKDGFVAIAQVGQQVAEKGSGWVQGDFAPACGTSDTLKKGVDMMNEHIFELPGFRPVNGTDSADKFLLNIRFALNNLNVDGTSDPIRGRVKVELFANGTTQILYAARFAGDTDLGIGEAALTIDSGAFPNGVREIEQRIIGSLYPTIQAPYGGTYTAKLRVYFYDFLSSYVAATGTAVSYKAVNATDPYIGVENYSLRIYNDG